MASNKEKDFSPSESSSTLPLLPDKEDYDNFHTVIRRQKKWYKSPFIVHIIIFCAYTIAFLAVSESLRGENCHKSMVYSESLLPRTRPTPRLTTRPAPARGAIQWEKTSFQNALGQENPFKGPPRPELDQAWHDLLENSNIRVSKEELEKINRTSIELADGSGEYMAGLNVHHHLHCLKSIRRVIYRDYYDLYEDDEMWIHLEHCMDDLRQAIMCNADFTLLTYDWLPNYRKPWPNFNVDYECVNWAILDEWAEKRVFSLFDQKSLVHPQLGMFSLHKITHWCTS
ncbi:hypothetical protein N0V90_004045 [Kalmusia sp. IMI 367209]|nr:hypothetical protein N0V90_004045 [Kalmusia sp. IMI 367209]